MGFGHWGALFVFTITSTISARAALPLCDKLAGTLPNSKASAGQANADIPIHHIVVIMQENHSFDTYYGHLNRPEFYGAEVDGINNRMSNPDASGLPTYVFHQSKLCVDDPDHEESSMDDAWDEGRNDGFMISMGPPSMGYFDQTDLPYYYELANHFAIADRYFCSTLGPTYPNRFFLLAGTAFGHTDNDDPDTPQQFDQKTIFDVLDQYGVSWKYYTDYTGDFGGQPGYLSLFQPLMNRDRAKIGSVADYTHDSAAGTLASVTFLDSNELAGEDEHPDADIQIGQAWVADKITSLMKGPLWKDSVLFLTYDENGGFFDHVPPPPACAPDDINPGTYSVYGFRVPFLAVSPYVKHHFVSHEIYDHTSILKFIETKFNLPALTKRDANANSLVELFDFAHPKFELPKLPDPTPSAARQCSSTRFVGY